MPPYIICERLAPTDPLEQLHLAVVQWFLFSACLDYHLPTPPPWILLVTNHASQVARLAAWLPKPTRQVAIYRGDATMEEVPAMVAAHLRQPAPERVLDRWDQMTAAVTAGDPVWAGYAPPPPPVEGEEWEGAEEAGSEGEEAAAVAQVDLIGDSR